MSMHRPTDISTADPAAAAPLAQKDGTAGQRSWYDDDIKYVAGVGEMRARLLFKELGIATVGELLYCFPFRYIDRSRIYRIVEIDASGSSLVQFRGRVTGVAYAGTGRKRRFSAFVSDGTGQAELVWFQGIKWIEKRIEVGREYLIFGRPSSFRNELSLVHPEIETVEKALSRRIESGLQGIYSSTERLSSVLGAKGFHTIVCNAWRLAHTRIAETLPDGMRRRYGLVSLHDALYNIHFPQSPEALRQAQYRLKFEELLGVQLNVLARRSARLSKNNGFLFPHVGEVFNTFYREKLPFPLTEAQKRVVREIRQDTVTGYQMNRLLQGDVGSGKTLVALLSMLLAVDNGFQACMMAPTEILARQHYATLTRLLEGLPVRVAILTGASKARERKSALGGIASGDVQLLVGTHALIEDRVQFRDLGLVVIDEQHRFGVEQRARMWTKNEQPPHVLVMTATPIPRTLAMTLYGDLDVSVIDELPPGRRPVQTVRYTDAMRLRVWGFLRRQIAQGRQVYIVYPLIKESEAMDYKNLQEGYEAVMRDFPLPEYVTEVVHGRMKPQDKEAAMRRFKSGEAQLLVATSVIEVGVDVPNATVMVIESAERFGLSQLHQLRGRVGRGAQQSYCILMSDEKLSKESRARLDAMCETNDGFRLAELDLKLRGAGDLAGTQQSGMAFDLKIANPTLDVQILQCTRDAAGEVLAADPLLEAAEHAGLRQLKKRCSGGKSTDFSMIS
ncbi:ATP-dependent DNA helicase RecG [uncultured Alistipes sp.]|uniref:ATP-dependent DNA helicase RecG n=1 Tax=uncultured Alistipes sp. TaxID=538949 RepID=UPI0026270BA1|nr:ATP-dependent DNA helicase RecG [uncultured Alistipes sp.]